MGKKSFFSIIFSIAGLIIGGFIGYFAIKENQRNKQIEKEISILREEAQKIRQNNHEMNEKIVYFETPQFQEKIAKEKLNLQKENENVAIIKPSPVSNEYYQEKENVPASEKKIQEKPNYKKWIDYFFEY